MSRAAFMAGVRAAAALFAEAESVRSNNPRTSPAAIEVEYLDGKPQRNFAAEHLRTLLARPDTLEGFAAALSDFLSMDTATFAIFYAEVTEAEIFGTPAP